VKNSSFADKQTFLVNLGKALHQFGTPSHRLESHLTNVSEFLGLQGSFIIMPTTLTLVMVAGLIFANVFVTPKRSL
jgi:uncharacterized membrane protein YjjP (DUF1212 family)